jgi:hypothetical protein
MIMRAASTTATLLLLLAIAACGERPQVVNYKQGTYQGKPDTPAYQSTPWNGDKAAWERELATRAQTQNEYKRIH